jgi:hypothetical protein
MSDFLTQIERIGAAEINGMPIAIHGSVGRAAMMGLPLPPELRPDGSLRDIDVFVPGVGKLALERFLTEEGLAEPAPVDAGLGMIVRESQVGTLTLNRGKLSMPINAEDIFRQTELYDAVGVPGLKIRSFSPMTMLALHHLEPKDLIRPTHASEDAELMRWFDENGVKLPDDLQASLDTFRHQVAKTYPLSSVAKVASEWYAEHLPEALRVHLRYFTHRFMRSVVGRESQYTGIDDWEEL